MSKRVLSTRPGELFRAADAAENASSHGDCGIEWEAKIPLSFYESARAGSGGSSMVLRFPKRVRGEQKDTNHITAESISSREA